MMYRAKCTACISLLKNCTHYKDSYFCHDAHDTFIEVRTEEEANIIEQLNGYQEGTFRTYNALLNLTEKEA